MPRTEKPRKRSARFCRDCGYELAPDNDGTCPMCARIRQLRMDFTVPRPSDLAAHRTGSLATDVSGVPDEWPPTVAEYRAILAERRLTASPGGQAATVIRTPALKQSQVLPPRKRATAPDEVASAPTAEPEPVMKDSASPSLKKATVRRKKGDSRRAARARVRSTAAPDSTTASATATFSAGVKSDDVPATPSTSTPHGAVRALGVTAAATRSETLATSRQGPHPLVRGGSVRHHPLRSRIVPLPSVITVAVLVASVLIGAAVPLLLSLP